MTKRLLLLVFFLVTSCASKVHKQDFAKRSEAGAIHALFQEYILGKIPAWNNFSFEAACRRQEQTIYLNYSKLMKSFSFDYYESFEVQRQFNRRLEEMNQNSILTSLLLEQQNGQLATVIERVKAQRFSADFSSYQRINLVWIDQILSEPNKLEKLLQTDMFNSGYPILLSFCRSSYQLEKLFLDKLSLDFSGEFIGAESFSRFGAEGKLNAFFMLDFSKIFSNEQSVYIYLPQNQPLPKGFQGSFEDIRYY